MSGNPQFTERLDAICRQLVTHYGVAGWWPAEHTFEVMVGAVLVQNTRWKNVERAIGGLRTANALSSGAVVGLSHDELVRLLRPAGCQSVKAQRLRALAAWVEARGGVVRLRRWKTARIRDGLLTVPGIGFETADAILCYGFDRPVFIADRYARRLLTRLGVVAGGVAGDYETCRAIVQAALDWSPARLQLLHAAIVRVSQSNCGARPHCAGCGLNRRCTKND